MKTPVLRQLSQWFMQNFLKTAVDGCQTTVYCAVAEELTDQSGLYYRLIGLIVLNHIYQWSQYCPRKATQIFKYISKLPVFKLKRRWVLMSCPLRLRGVMFGFDFLQQLCHINPSSVSLRQPEGREAMGDQ